MSESALSSNARRAASTDTGQAPVQGGHCGGRLPAAVLHDSVCEARLFGHVAVRWRLWNGSWASIETTSGDPAPLTSAGDPAVTPYWRRM